MSLYAFVLLISYNDTSQALSLNYYNYYSTELISVFYHFPPNYFVFNLVNEISNFQLETRRDRYLLVVHSY